MGVESALVSMRHDVRPGDIGRLVSLHGELYARECGWDWTFEAYAGRTFGEWADRYDAARDRIWIVEAAGTLVGSIAIISAGADVAQLRWFLLHPSQRDRGLGRRLVADALEFARERGYARVILSTAAPLTAATRLYRSFGFEQTGARTEACWGATVVHEDYALTLR
jgi:GNAT superfamily N-acetyltransferase